MVETPRNRSEIDGNRFAPVWGHRPRAFFGSASSGLGAELGPKSTSFGRILVFRALLAMPSCGCVFDATRYVHTVDDMCGHLSKVGGVECDVCVVYGRGGRSGAAVEISRPGDTD